jgi:hypothetical protein
MRTVITAAEHPGQVLVEQQRLSKRPSGNADQRKKQLKHGWQPSWVKCAPAELKLNISQDLGFLPLGTLPEPPEIEAAREIVKALDNQS